MTKIANCKIYSVLVGSTPIDCIAGVFVRVIAMLLNRNTELQIAERLWPVKGRGCNFYSPQFSSVINSKMAATARRGEVATSRCHGSKISGSQKIMALQI